MIYLQLNGNRVIESHNQLLNVIVEIRREVLQGALQLEEIVSADKEEKSTVVLIHFENADRYLKLMVEGGENQGFTIFPLSDVSLNQDISDLHRNLDTVRTLARNRFDSYGLLIKNIETEQKFDVSFDSFLIKLNSVESKFHQKLNQDKMTFRQTGYIFNVVSICMAVFVMVMIYRMRERDKKQKLEINKIHEEIIEANKNLTKKVQKDSLTNLPNRELFIHLLDSAISLAKRKKQWIVVFFIDLDQFKSINDYLGHHAGDKLLKSVAKRLRESVRGEDVVARLAGDEFTVMLAPESSHDSALESAHNVAQKINEVLVSPVTINMDKSEPYISASIGIALYPQDGRDSETLMKNADTSMYDVKKSGKNDYRFFSQELNEETQRRLQLEQDLNKAISKQQMELYYQPQWSYETGELFGLEVLIRWNHPGKGILLPDSFIPIAESYGLVSELDSWVLMSTCRQFALWEQQGCAPSQISINVSTNQFSKPGLVKELATVLKKYQIDPRKLELEITEETLMHNPEYTSTILTALKQLGIKTAIDDFGAGHLSLVFLSKFPVDTLTLNRLIIKNVGVENSASSIIESLIKLAHKLDMNIVAEGIETENQNHFLAAQNCDYAQGYLFNRPVNGEAMGALLRKNKEKS